MSANLEKLTGEWLARREEYPETAGFLEQAVLAAQEEGAPREFGTVTASKSPEIRKVYPEVPLEKDLAGQREIVIERVVKPLGLNVDNALKQLSFKFPARKPFYDDDGFHLTVPLIVPQFRGVSFLAMADAAGFYVLDSLRGQILAGEVHPWEDPRGVDVPDRSHGIWVQDGTQWVHRKPVDVRNQLQEDKYKALLTGGLVKGFAQALLRWDMVQGKGWDLIGDSVGTADVPYVLDWRAGWGFYARWGGDARPDFRAFVCGS